MTNVLGGDMRRQPEPGGHDQNQLAEAVIRAIRGTLRPAIPAVLVLVAGSAWSPVRDAALLAIVVIGVMVSMGFWVIRNRGGWTDSWH